MFYEQSIQISPASTGIADVADMPRYRYRVSANGHDFGVYCAESEQGARDACAQDAGYESESEMVSRLERPSDLIAELVPDLDGAALRGDAA